MPGFIKRAKERVVDFPDEKKSGMERRKLEQEMLKAVHDSRKKVLEGATIVLSMKQLAEQLDAPGGGDGIANLGVLDLPGCFAIARYGKLELAKDPTSFTGIYVGKAACVGEGIARTIAPTGNADVYADISTSRTWSCTCSFSLPTRLTRSTRRWSNSSQRGSRTIG